jgi:hypothetical protein
MQKPVYIRSCHLFGKKLAYLALKLFAESSMGPEGSDFSLDAVLGGLSLLKLCSADADPFSEMESSGAGVPPKMFEIVVTDRGAIDEGKVATSVKMSLMPCADSRTDCMLPLHCF